MRFTFEVGEQERTRIEYSRNPLSGAVRLLANGVLMASRSAFSPSTHFSFTLVRRLSCTVGSLERHILVIEQVRPLLFAGFRPQTYRVLVDGKLVHEQRGY